MTTDPKGRTAAQALEEDHAVGPHLEGTLRDTNQDGQYDVGTIEGGVVEWDFNHDVESNSGQANLGGRFSGGAMTGKAEIGVVDGQGGWTSAEVTYNHVSGDVFASDGNGSMIGVGGSYDLLHATAYQENWVGHNTATGDYGFHFGGGAVAEAISGEVSAVIMAPVPKILFPFLPTEWARKVPILGDWSVGAEASGGGVVGTGLAGNIEATYNPDLERGHISVDGELADILGLKGDLDVFFQKIPPVKARRVGPSVITKGASTVLIGD